MRDWIRKHCFNIAGRKLSFSCLRCFNKYSQTGHKLEISVICSGGKTFFFVVMKCGVGTWDKSTVAPVTICSSCNYMFAQGMLSKRPQEQEMEKVPPEVPFLFKITIQVGINLLRGRTHGASGTLGFWGNWFLIHTSL